MTASVYLLTGETFLAEEAIDKIRAEHSTDPLSELSFDAGSAAAEILGALQTSSLLGGKRLVVVRAAHELKKEQADAIAGYIEGPSPDSVLVLVANGRTKLDAVVKAHGAIVVLDVPKGRRLVGWVRQRAAEHKLKVDERAAWALIDAVGSELRDLDGAISQLVTSLGPGAHIGAAEVRAAFPRLADERIYAFTDAVGDRKLSEAMTTLRRLLDQGDEPLVLFGSLNAHVKRMLRARRFADRGPKAVGDALGLPGWKAARLQRQAGSYKEEELVAAVATLAETDVEMKGGDLGPAAALERAVIHIVAGTSPQKMF
ncbi:MAG TPA: DNA polymerase III subunit delta [Actinomycetota bacterium]|nr:DNA polymerase III subunit delta [Actinomycetota bacterium]